MKIKTSELTGAALDWAVAKCEGFIKNETWFDHRVGRHFIRVVKKNSFEDHVYWAPSTNWQQGGPIIERENIGIGYGVGIDGDKWEAGYTTPEETGPTPLIAAMRCFVASKLGDTVEVPDELC